ncbi:MAG: US12 family protein [Planctomycetia bacterium]|nr:US12 family protein [Planctomycetia bacterium]
MSYLNEAFDAVAADRPRSERAQFLVKTYSHLLGAVVAFVLVVAALFSLGWAQAIALKLSRAWLLALGGFVLVSWLASRFAHRAEALSTQYVGLGLAVVAQAVLFCPLLVVAELKAPGAIQSAALVTVLGFGALTGIVFATRKDFSFLRGVLLWAGVVTVLMIIGAIVFGLQLGVGFSVLMIAIAGASILHDTSEVMLRFPVTRYVGASLELFSSVALLFWYVLRLFMSSRD